MKALSADDDFAFLTTFSRNLPENELSNVGLIRGHGYSILATFEVCATWAKGHLRGTRATSIQLLPLPVLI